MNKSNIDQYVPPYSVTQKKYYWIGLRQADWTLYNNTGFFLCIINKNSNNFDF